MEEMFVFNENSLFIGEELKSELNIPDSQFISLDNLLMWRDKKHIQREVSKKISSKVVSLIFFDGTEGISEKEFLSMLPPNSVVSDFWLLNLAKHLLLLREIDFQDALKMFNVSEKSLRGIIRNSPWFMQKGKILLESREL